MNCIDSTGTWVSETVQETLQFLTSRAKSFGEKVPIIGRTVETISGTVVGTVSIVYSVGTTIIAKIGEKIGQVTGSESFKAFWVRQQEIGNHVGQRGKELLYSGSIFIWDKVDKVADAMKIFGERVPIIGRTIQHVTCGLIGVAEVIYSLSMSIIGKITQKIGETVGNRPLQALAIIQQKAAQKIGEKGVGLLASSFGYIDRNADKIMIIAGGALIYFGCPVIGGIFTVLGTVQFLHNVRKPQPTSNPLIDVTPPLESKEPDLLDLSHHEGVFICNTLYQGNHFDVLEGIIPIIEEMEKEEPGFYTTIRDKDGAIKNLCDNWKADLSEHTQKEAIRTSFQNVQRDHTIGDPIII